MLSLQAQHDYLAGNYPVVREDAAQMCALQMQAEAGPTMLESPESLETAIERFIHKQVLLQSSSPIVQPEGPLSNPFKPLGLPPAMRIHANKLAPEQEHFSLLGKFPATG